MSSLARSGLVGTLGRSSAGTPCAPEHRNRGIAIDAVRGTVLRTVTYNNTSNTPNTTDRTISFQANDGDSTNNLSNVATKLVSVAASNDAPTVTTSGGVSTFTEGGGPIAVDNLVTVTDPDSATLASATVTISNLLNPTFEFLAATTGGTSITANYVAPTLTLTGVDSIANYQMVLRSVTYDNTSNAPSSTQRSITFQVNDGAANSNIAAKGVDIVTVNSARVVTTSVGTTAFVEDGPAVAVDSGITEVVRTTLDYAPAELQDRNGLFVAGANARSIVARGGPELLEGGYYVWQTSEIRQLLGPKLQREKAFDVGTISIPPGCRLVDDQVLRGRHAERDTRQVER